MVWLQHVWVDIDDVGDATSQTQGATWKIDQIELIFIVSGHAYILGGFADFQNFQTSLGVPIFLWEEKCQKMNFMHDKQYFAYKNLKIS